MPYHWRMKTSYIFGAILACSVAGTLVGARATKTALLVVSEAVVGELGLTPLARVVGAASAGVEPRVMGVGPVPAVQRLLGRRGVANFW